VSCTMLRRKMMDVPLNSQEFDCFSVAYEICICKLRNMVNNLHAKKVMIEWHLIYGSPTVLHPNTYANFSQ
jgi:hypothetical protein